jgi:cell division protein FtsL
MERITEKIYKSYLLEEIKLFSKYLYPIVGVGILAGILVIYVSYYMKLEREIVNITYQNSLKKHQILELKKEISVLSSPERVKDIAEKDLNMIPINYDNIKFIEKGN